MNRTIAIYYTDKLLLWVYREKTDVELGAWEGNLIGGVGKSKDNPLLEIRMRLKTIPIRYR